MFDPKLITAIEGLSQFISQFHFKGCELHLWEEADFAEFTYPELLHDNRGHSLVPGDTYVIITCDNDYRYYVNVSGDSPLCACAEVMEFLVTK